MASSLQAHISYLRRVLRARDAIEARNSGYQLNLSADAVDVGQAMQLIASAAKGNDHATSAAQLAAALELWRGPSLVDVAEAAWLRDQGRRLDETRLEAIERLFATRLALGEDSLLVAELEGLAAQYPFRENLHQMLITALYRSGRQADALGAYHRIRQALASELGIDPSPGLRDLETAMLRQDPRLDSPRPSVSVASATPARIRPAELPPTITAFTGRQDHLSWLSSHLPNMEAEHPSPAHAPTILAVSGTAGVGKTALVVEWAHQVKQRFPDGQLYVNLRGFDPSGVVMDPAEAVRGFLDALGVPGDQMPAAAHAQANLYRSVLADKRILIVVDNARDEQQVRPLLPGAPGCMVIVTSRNQLAGLVAAVGAQPLTVDLPPVDEARQILTGRLGARLADSESQAIDDIVARCAGLPLALAIVAARAVLTPSVSLTSVAAELRPAALDSFESADPATSIRGVFSWSYHTLSDRAARLFRLLGACPGPDITVSAAASVVGLPPTEVRSLLAELTHAHLLTQNSVERFGFHELLRAYALERAEHHDSPEQRDAARLRLLDHQLHSTYVAMQLLKPGRGHIDLHAPAPGAVVLRPVDRAAALAWFAEERSGLLATIARRSDGHDRHTWQLAWVLVGLLITRGDRRDNELAQQAGLRAAQRLHDRTAQAHAHRSLGKVYADLDRLNEAVHHSQAALDLFEQVDNPGAAADIHLNLGTIAARQGDLQRALIKARHAHRLYRSLGHRAGQAYAAHNIGWTHGRLGDYQNGLAYCKEALEILVEVGDLEATANTWDCLGALHFGLPDPMRGEYCYLQAIALYRRLGDCFREADVHIKLGDQYHRAGDEHTAHQAWQRALAVLDDLEPETAAQIQARLRSAPLL